MWRTAGASDTEANKWRPAQATAAAGRSSTRSHFRSSGGAVAEVAPRRRFRDNSAGGAKGPAMARPGEAQAQPLSTTFRRSVIDLGLAPGSPGFRAVFATVAALAKADYRFDEQRVFALTTRDQPPVPTGA